MEDIRLQLRFELTSERPDAASAISGSFQRAVSEVLGAEDLRPSVVEAPRIRFEQPFPLTPEQQAELFVAVVTFALSAGPGLASGLRDFAGSVLRRMRGEGVPTGISGRIESEGRSIEFEGIPPEKASDLIERAVEAVSPRGARRRS